MHTELIASLRRSDDRQRAEMDASSETDTLVEAALLEVDGSSLLPTDGSHMEASMAEARPLALTQAEMVVLFDWLARSSDQGSPVTDLHEAEQRVLWDLEAALEGALTAPFSDDYATLLDAARREVLGQRAR